MASLEGAPITIGHPRAVSSENWNRLSVGHVGDSVKRDNKFVSAHLRVQRSDAVRGIENRELVELSCGYEVKIDHTPSVYNGEAYDCVQREIRYNHVGLGPRNWGRAGSEVRLHLDSSDERPKMSRLQEAEMRMKERSRDLHKRW